jgi:integrase/recombinase XerC
MAKLALPKVASPLAHIDLDLFRNWLSDAFEYPYAEKTRKAYSRISRDLVQFVGDHGATTLDEVSPDVLRSFLTRKENGVARYAPATRITRQSALALFWRFAIDMRWALDNPLEQLLRDRQADRLLAGQGGRKPKRKPAVLSWGEQAAVLDSVKCNPRDETRIRDLALITTLLTTGLRREEVCVLKLRDVHLSEGRLRIIGKGNKERVVEFRADDPSGMQEAMAAWLLLRGHIQSRSPVETNCLFLTRAGKPLTPNLVYQQVSTYIRQAGLTPVHYGPHVLRHSAASRMLAMHMPIRRVMENLGHEHLATLEIYAHLLEPLPV